MIPLFPMFLMFHFSLAETNRHPFDFEAEAELVADIMLNILVWDLHFSSWENMLI